MENIHHQSERKIKSFDKIYGKSIVQKQHIPFYRIKQAQTASAIMSNPCIKPKQQFIRSMRKSLNKLKLLEGTRFNPHQLSAEHVYNMKKIVKNFPQKTSILNNLIKYSQYQKRSKPKKYFYLIEGSVASQIMNAGEFKQYLKSKMENKHNQSQNLGESKQNHEIFQKCVKADTTQNYSENPLENSFPKRKIGPIKSNYNSKDQNRRKQERYSQRRILFSSKNVQKLNNPTMHQRQQRIIRKESLTFNKSRKTTYQKTRAKKQGNSWKLHSWDVSQSLDITHLENRTKQNNMTFNIRDINKRG